MALSKASIISLTFPIKIFLNFIIFATFISPSQAHETNNNALINDLSKNLKQCSTTVNARDLEIILLEKQIKDLKAKNTLDQQIATNYAKWQTAASALITKQEKILIQSKQIETKFTENVQLCQTSVDELKEKLIALNKLYNDAVKHCLRPWYLRWEFWLGGVIGIAVGIPI